MDKRPRAARLPTTPFFRFLPMTLPSSAAAHDLQARLFNALNDRMRRNGVETAERAPLMSLFMAALHLPGGPEAMMEADLAPEALSQALLDMLEATAVPELAAFAHFMRLRLIQGDHATTGAQALHAVVHHDIPQLCHERGWTVAACYAALQAEAFKLVDLYEAFQTHVGGNDLGQYFTPRHIVRAMAEMVEILRGHPFSRHDRIYDPAAGVGGFLIAALERARVQGANEIPSLIGGETTTSVAHMARLNLWMASGQATCGTIFNQSSLERDHLPLRGDVGDQTLGQALPPAHPMSAELAAQRAPTAVLMNPPFPEDKKAYQSFEFVEHALRTLTEGGTLAALIPAVLVIGEDPLHVRFRDRMLQHGQLQAVIAMPPDLFAPGASINTYVVVLRKQAGGHDLNEAVFFARAQEDGFEMDRGVHRRNGPRTAAESLARGWSAALGMGGSLARLFLAAPDARRGSGWLAAHVRAKGPKHHHDRQASSERLPALGGQDWAPERFIQDHPSSDRIVALANHIASQSACEQVRQHFLARKAGALPIEPIGPDVFDRVQHRLASHPALDDVFQIARASVPSAKGWKEQGSLAIVSASEQDNGICGYTDEGVGASVPGLTVAKNGRPGVSRVQTQTYAVTGDVAALTPKDAGWTVPELCVLAALIEVQSWRFSYGRKASERRLLALKLG